MSDFLQGYGCIFFFMVFDGLDLSDFINSFDINAITEFVLILICKAHDCRAAVIKTDVAKNQLVLAAQHLLIVERVENFAGDSVIIKQIIQFFSKLRPIDGQTALVKTALDLFFLPNFVSSLIR